MDLKFLFGWGVGIYSVMYLAWAGVTIYGYDDSSITHFSMLILLVCLAMQAGRSLMLQRAIDILPYSFGWVVIAIVLDVIFLGPIQGSGMFWQPALWAGYTLLCVIPLLSPYTHTQYQSESV